MLALIFNFHKKWCTDLISIMHYKLIEKYGNIQNEIRERTYIRYYELAFVMFINYMIYLNNKVNYYKFQKLLTLNKIVLLYIGWSIYFIIMYFISSLILSKTKKYNQFLNFKFFIQSILSVSFCLIFVYLLLRGY